MAQTPNVNCGDGEEGCPTGQPNPSFAFDGKNNPNVTDGKYVPPDYCAGTLDYSTSDCADKEADYVAGLMSEALNIAAGPVNVFPLLGVHNQGSTADQVGDGYPLSSGTPSGSNVQNAFSVADDSWKSIQTGAAVLTGPAFIGYDFGNKKAWEAIGPAQDRYFPTEPIRKKISTIKIRQSANVINRASQVRVEASDDGTNWKRVDVINLPNTSALISVGINAAAAYNKWRFVPVFFNGVAANEPWEVVELHLLESTQLSLENIQDTFLNENRDRAYCRTSIMIKCTYDLLDVQTELAKFGINLPETYMFTCSFATMVKALGRPVVVGDVVELPGEIQYDANLRIVRKWLEVTDAKWSTEGYTNNWKPNLFKFYAQPILPSIEHKDLLGVPGKVVEQQSDSSILEDGFLQNIQAYQASEGIAQEMKDAVPQDGSDGANIQSGRAALGKNGTYDGNDIYSADAIPPNGEQFTSGDVLPLAADISDGHWHRQTFVSVPQSIRPPERLLRWDASISRWRVVEINHRGTPESHKKTMANLLNSGNKIDLDKKL